VLRVVRNVLEGDGPVLNVGERVEAYASPLWLALVALARALAPRGVHLEWVAVGLGLAMSVAGLACAVLAAWRLWSAERGCGPVRAGAALPLGAAAVAALPPFWDYATAGLETGLALLWLGATYLGLVSLALSPPDDARPHPERSTRAAAEADGPRDDGSEPTLLEGLRSPPVLAVAVGLGPLVRPDLLPFALVFLALLGVLARARTLGRALVLLAWAAALPLAYQVFRMGYFAALVPNGALARELGVSAWGRGLDYLADLVWTYALWLPLVALVGWSAFAGRDLWRRGERDRALLVAAPIVGAVVHTLAVVGAGGDDAHARALLPSVFAALMPAAVVVAVRRRAAAALAAAVLPWAVLCAVGLRAPVPSADGKAAAPADERRRLAELWGLRHPVTLDGLVSAPGSPPALERRRGLELARLALRRRAVVVRPRGGRTQAGAPLGIPEPLAHVRPRTDVDAEVVAWHETVGRVAYGAGANVRLVDASGTGDPLAARTRPAPGAPERRLPTAWVLARYASAATPTGAVRLAEDPDVAAARRALACRPLRELVAATGAELSLRRFLANVAYSVRARSLRFSADPRRAEREVCGRE
jgi:arabinofuranosyltransferase